MALETGKLPAALLRTLIAAGPPLPPEVRLGPAVGEDACAIDVPEGVLVAATDPITLTGSGLGAHAVVVNANDVAVTGARPRWFLAVVLLPPGSDEAAVREVFAGMRQALARTGAALVGGHTEVTAAVSQPVVVGQMLGVCQAGALVCTSGARVGDAVVQVGPAPIEGGAVLAVEAADRLGEVPEDVRRAARRALDEPGISVVEPALAAAAAGARAMHDPTEGGLSAGLHELAEASGTGIEVDADAVQWFDPALAVCRALGADPWGTLASGTLLACFAEDALPRALAALAAAGHPGRAIARVVSGAFVRTRDGRPLPRYDRDELARVL